MRWLWAFGRGVFERQEALHGSGGAGNRNVFPGQVQDVLPGALQGFGQRTRRPLEYPLKLVVGAVAVRWAACLLAAAEPGFFCLFGFVGDRLDACSLVRAVTEWLVLASATGAPVVGLSLLDIDAIGRFLGNHDIVTHSDSPFVV
jgi:hypothetical protein